MEDTTCMVCGAKTWQTNTHPDECIDLCFDCSDKIVQYFRAIFPKLSPDGQVMEAAKYGLIDLKR